MEDSKVADALYKVLSENASNEIECLIISNNEGVGFDYYDIRLDLSRLRAIFPKLHTVVRCEDVKIENSDNEGIRLINHDYLDTCSFDAYEKKDFEKALYYGEFSTLTEYYWGNYSFGRLLYDLGKEEEAEKYLKRVAESKYIIGDGNFLYGHLLDKQGRYKELPDLITCLHPKEVRIKALDGSMTVNFDGETRHLEQVTFRLSERKLALVVPKGVRP